MPTEEAKNAHREYTPLTPAEREAADAVRSGTDPDTLVPGDVAGYQIEAMPEPNYSAVVEVGELMVRFANGDVIPKTAWFKLLVPQAKNKEQRACMECETPFLPKIPKQIYCCATCAKRAAGRRDRAGRPSKAKKLAERPCDKCEKTFRPWRKDQHVCSTCSRTRKGPSAAPAQQETARPPAKEPYRYPEASETEVAPPRFHLPAGCNAADETAKLAATIGLYRERLVKFTHELDTAKDAIIKLNRIVSILQE